METKIEDYIRNQSREDYNHTGSIRLNNAEVLYHDWVAHEIPSEWIEEMSMKDLITNPSDNNISNKVYKTTMYVEKSSGRTLQVCQWGRYQV